MKLQSNNAIYFGNITSIIPIVSANIQTKNKALASRTKPYHVFLEHSLAVVGLTTIHTKSTSSPSVDTDFLDPSQVLQKTVDEIHANNNVD
jgi:5'-nucleotidase